MFKSFSILLVFLFIGRYPAQQYNFHCYSVKEGVAQSQVYSLLQDSRGYLWMGTRGGGVSRFDGLNFKTFTVKEGLVNNYVFCLSEDEHHNIWIGTNSGLSMYNGVTFRNFQASGDSAQVWIQDIDFDRQGRKWLASNEGVLQLDAQGFKNIHVIAGEKKKSVRVVHIDKKGAIWFGSDEGLFRVNEKSGGFSIEKYGKQKGFINNAITSIREDAKGRLWIGTYGDGAYVYDGKKFFRIDENQELYKQTVLGFYFDNHDNVWMATLNSGVAQYNLVAKNFSWLTEKEGLSNNHVRSILQDQSGNYWFGTSGGGVCNYFGKQFTHYDKTSGIAGNFIYSVYRDSKQRLWIGTSDKGLTVLDSSGFFPYGVDSGFANVKVKTICEDNNGRVYFGTDGQGVFRFDGFEFYPLEELKKKYIRSIVKDKDGNLWIATAGMGLYKVTPGPEKDEIKNFTTAHGLLHNRLTTLHYDKQGRLWYGTEVDGVGCVANDEVQPIVLNTKSGLRSNAIRSLAEDASGYLWIGTAGYGICNAPLYQGDFKIQCFDHTHGLTSTNVYLLTADNNNNVFVGTETGLDHLFLDKTRKITDVKHYGKGEGFTGIETCQNAVFKDSDGTIWFGTINGLSKYNPANRVKNDNEPITTIGDVKLFYESVRNTEYKVFAGDWNTIREMILPYSQNHLTFEFQGINFSNPEAVKYQWKLEGFDKDWSPVSKSDNIVYSNLNPGKYTFMVRACNEDGVWNKEPVSLRFRIETPFWKSWWFILLVVLGISGLVYVIFKWRVNRVKQKAAEEQKKLQLEKEVVELEQKALRLQMNPHFIFNALNSIQSQIGNDNEQAARYYLAKFSRLMRQILDNSRNPSITLEEELSTLENYLLIEKFCNGDRFDYKIIVDETIEKDYVKIPPMLLQPFIENSIKHGLKYVEGKRGEIVVEFSEKNGTLECSVTDNGIGREKSSELNKASKETYHKSTALLVTRERLDLLKKDENMQALEMIDMYDEAGKAVGTKVIVRIPAN